MTLAPTAQVHRRGYGKHTSPASLVTKQILERSGPVWYCSRDDEAAEGAAPARCSNSWMIASSSRPVALNIVRSSARWSSCFAGDRETDRVARWDASPAPSPRGVASRPLCRPRRPRRPRRRGTGHRAVSRRRGTRRAGRRSRRTLNRPTRRAGPHARGTLRTEHRPRRDRTVAHPRDAVRSRERSALIRTCLRFFRPASWRTTSRTRGPRREDAATELAEWAG